MALSLGLLSAERENMCHNGSSRSAISSPWTSADSTGTIFIIVIWSQYLRLGRAILIPSQRFFIARVYSSCLFHSLLIINLEPTSYIRFTKIAY